MAFIEYNPNPRGINTGDCVIRAICKALDMEWEKVYMDLTVRGLQDAMWGDTNAVWEKYLKENGSGRYSRDEAKDKLIGEMEGMMGDVSPEAQHAIQKAIHALGQE